MPTKPASFGKQAIPAYMPPARGDDRPSAHERGYTFAWSKVRRRVAAASHRCEAGSAYAGAARRHGGGSGGPERRWAMTMAMVLTEMKNGLGPFNEEAARALYAGYLTDRDQDNNHKLRGHERGAVAFLLWVRGMTCGRIANELRASVGVVNHDVRCRCNSVHPDDVAALPGLRQRRAEALEANGVVVRPWRKRKRRAKVVTLVVAIAHEQPPLSDRKLRELDPEEFHRRRWAAQAQAVAQAVESEPVSRPPCLAIPPAVDDEYTLAQRTAVY